MPLQYKAEFSDESGFFTLSRELGFEDEFRISQIAGCEPFLRALKTHVDTLGLTPDLDTCADAAWELLVDACMNPLRRSAIRKNVMRAWTDLLYVAIDRPIPANRYTLALDPESGPIIRVIDREHGLTVFEKRVRLLQSDLALTP